MTYKRGFWGILTNIRAINNDSTSQIILATIEPWKKAAHINSLGFTKVILSFKYFGVLLTSSRLLARDFQPLVDKMIKEANLWRNINLSYATKIVLINSVMLTWFCFDHSCLFRPKRLWNYLNTIVGSPYSSLKIG